MSDSISRTGFLGGTAALFGAASNVALGADAGVKPDSKLLLKGGHVISMDPAIGELKKADVLIQGGKIRAIKPTIAAGDAYVIDASQSIVMPGLIDTHHHMWEGLFRQYFPDLSYRDYFKFMVNGVGPSYRPVDAYYGTLVSALGALNGGTTTIHDFSQMSNTPAHTDAIIQAHRDSGMRVVFGYGFPSLGTEWSVDRGTSKFPEDIFRLKKQYYASNDQLTTLTLAAEGPGTTERDPVLKQWQVAKEADVPIIVHAGSAGKRGFYEAYADVPGFFRPTTTYIHCCAFSEAEWKLVADSGGMISISPGSEMPMGHGLPVTQIALDHGLRPTLSIDVETTEPGDLFTTMRLTLYLQRMNVNLRGLAGEKNLPKYLTTRDILQLATVDGAKSTHVDHKVGMLTPGKEADILLLRRDKINVIPMNDAIGAVVEGMDTSNIDTILVRGKVVKRHGELVGINLAHLRVMAERSRDYVVARAKEKQRIPGSG
jgi:cytosine/adenosine deaminase-related metal-dependent hydrolase